MATKLTFIKRYPLPIAAGAATTAITGYASWQLWEWQDWDIFNWWSTIPVALSLAAGAAVGVLLWNRLRLLCQLVVAWLWVCWDAHAAQAGLVVHDSQLDSGRYKDKPVTTFKGPRAHPKIRNGKLIVPIKTNSGKATITSETAKELAEVLGLHFIRTVRPGKPDKGIQLIFTATDEAM